MSLRFLYDPLKATYCSKACQTKASSESHNLLFGLDPPLPNFPAMTPMSEIAKEERKKAQERLAASLNCGKTTPLLVARFIGKQVTAEIRKLGADATSTTPITASRGASSEGYSLYDHIERLRYLELSTQQEEVQLISQVLETAMPGLEQFVTDERYTTLKGKMAYNAIGVCYGGGRSDKVSFEVSTESICHSHQSLQPFPILRHEDAENTRTPYGTKHQIGCGLYQVSSYVRHISFQETSPHPTRHFIAVTLLQPFSATVIPRWHLYSTSNRQSCAQAR